MTTVREETFELLRKLGVTTMFGNPGSTEQPFLKDFPDDFTYILGLQEASVLGMADGFAQSTRSVVCVNLHTAPGLGNSLGNLVNTRVAKTPMILTTGQQTREMLLMEPWLTNVNATEFPRPHVKWSYETTHAEETPAAFMRAYATAKQSPQGPVYLSLPMGDWDAPSLGNAAIRSIAHRVAPDPERIEGFASILKQAANPALVLGADLDRADAWQEGIDFAERLGVPVFGSPFSERCGFPEDHAQYAGLLKAAIGPMCEQLRGFDLVMVIGAPVFRYYPYVPGSYLPTGCRLLQITDDPEEAGRAPVGDSLIADAKLALRALLSHTAGYEAKNFKRSVHNKQSTTPDASGMSLDDLFESIGRVRPDDAILVDESPSNLESVHRHLPIRRPLSYFSMASGGLGFGLPGGIGVALGERSASRHRPVISIIGDGSFQYSVQSLWTAARQKTRVVIIVPVNEEYAILKGFAKLIKTPGVPGLDIPAIDIAGLARAYGCRASNATKPDEVSDLVKESLQHDGPTVIAVKVSSAIPPLL